MGELMIEEMVEQDFVLLKTDRGSANLVGIPGGTKDADLTDAHKTEIRKFDESLSGLGLSKKQKKDAYRRIMAMRLELSKLD